MKIEKKSAQGLNSVYSVSFSSDFIAAEKQTLLSQHAKSYKKPGFRPGKVPLAVIEKEFGAAATQQVLDDQLTKANEKIIKENNLKISTRPTVKETSEDANKEMVFELSYESMPEIELQDLSGIKLEKITRTVSDEEFKTAFADFLDKRAPFNQVDKKVEPDHIVTVSLSMSVDGNPISDIQDRTFYLCPANDKALYPAVAKALIGKKITDSGSVEEQLDDTFPISQARGKKVTIQYVVKNVEEKEPITEDNLEFFKNNGFESVDAAKAQVKEKLENE
ncbi:MAG: trigger factor, partial [Flavobacteriaceae bacterium]|nr:trigger factor [Flavobacteriaceae bacterium]